ncbi:T9SS type B sorting domain-containing protein [Hufsiella ginkgonis]|uniref:T9SS type B sorting domain-containing protein n=1 Tax=Hufsiella ginkgonis TaxID=2695274 RepID=A0A7K1XWQ0_9SPHI|nr:T9SS type B sorting domain-containing protein [Hufsiella ginkgonis]MXV15434.1 T9SS type B sorting domain-containing protein [Hufsiella ginkgonis]
MKSPFARYFAVFAVLCWLPVLAAAQTCSGSLGDPVVNFTFGKGAAESVPLPGAATNYTYLPSWGCLNDGYYQVASNITNCHTGTWWQLTEDHTPGDQGGNMMIVNASNNPGVFYQQTVTGLCPNTTYEFAAWIINIDKSDPILPNISFSIETTSGQVLSQPYSTGNIQNSSTPTWVKYGFLFSTTPGVQDVVLVIRNNAPGGQGNDLALDDITFRACGPVLNTQNTSQANSSEVCEGTASTVKLLATTSAGFSDPVYQWQVNQNDGTGWTDIAGATGLTSQYPVNAASSKGYSFRLASSERANIGSPRCRVYSLPFDLPVVPKVTADAGPDKVTFENQPVKLEGKATGKKYTVLWTPADYLDDPTSLQPLASPPTDMTYRLLITSDDGCTSSAAGEVKVKVYNNLVIPNTFSPNGDGINDTWQIIGLSSYVQSITRIYDRYGSMVHQSKNTNLVWDGSIDGKKAGPGTYNYIIRLNDGSTFSGWLMLVR